MGARTKEGAGVATAGDLQTDPQLATELHMKEKRSIRRDYQQQRVTGLVVNQTVNLPRKTRRWLRAVKHRAAGGVKRATLPPAQIKGWEAFELMVRTQRGS